MGVASEAQARIWLALGQSCRPETGSRLMGETNRHPVDVVREDRKRKPENNRPPSWTNQYTMTIDGRS